jgi:DNA (cytosine-5)-methyltransferase 3A
MKVLSLFNGISCGRVALERAGINVDRYVSYEIDKYANMVAQKNYPDDEYCGDVTTADFTQYKGFDIVIGGSPCTYWSIAKTNREETPDGIGGQLFMHFVRAVKETGCKYFLYENNYSIHKNIKAFISEQLGVEPIMINSALVSAQQRKRCYWTNIPNVVQPEDRGIVLADVLENAEREKRRNVSGIAEPARVGHLSKSTGQANRIYSVEGKSVCQSTPSGGGGSATGLYAIPAKSVSPTDSKEHTVYKVEGGEIEIKGKIYPIKLKDGYYIIRKLTPVECERIQTLPDNYTEGVSNTQRYKCIGNGWTVEVIAHILNYIQEENECL